MSEIKYELVVGLAKRRMVLVEAISLIEEWERNIEKKLNGPAKNFLPIGRTVNEVRDMQKPLYLVKVELLDELDAINQQLVP